MTELIERSVVDAELRVWIMLGFTTTTVLDITVSAVVMMATVKVIRPSLLSPIPTSLTPTRPRNISVSIYVPQVRNSVSAMYTVTGLAYFSRAFNGPITGQISPTIISSEVTLSASIYDNAIRLG